MIINLITDAPKHNHALMKISTYHKQRGDDVYLNFPLMPADRTYVSLLYSDSIGSGIYGDVFGGPAFVGGNHNGRFNVSLPLDIERCAPDLGLYKIDYSLGYSFRPCFRNCSFCKVGRMQHPDTEHHSIWEFHDPSRTKICLLNNNTFQDKRWKETFEEIWEASLTVIDENGYDLRLVDDEKAAALKRTKFQGKLHFAWDRMKDEKEIMRGLQCLKQHKVKGSVYVLVEYDTTEAENLHRCQVLKDLGFDFYIMPYGGTRYGKAFKRFADSFMWRKFKTIGEAWKEYKKGAHVLCEERLPEHYGTSSTTYNSSNTQAEKAPASAH